jgi:hypothetical protein
VNELAFARWVNEVDRHARAAIEHLLEGQALEVDANGVPSWSATVELSFPPGRATEREYELANRELERRGSPARVVPLEPEPEHEPMATLTLVVS